MRNIAIHSGLMSIEDKTRLGVFWSNNDGAFFVPENNYREAIESLTSFRIETAKNSGWEFIGGTKGITLSVRAPFKSFSRVDGKDRVTFGEMDSIEAVGDTEFELIYFLTGGKIDNPYKTKKNPRPFEGTAGKIVEFCVDSAITKVYGLRGNAEQDAALVAIHGGEEMPEDEM